jgi:hypothetical protein
MRIAMFVSQTSQAVGPGRRRRGEKMMQKMIRRLSLLSSLMELTMLEQDPNLAYTILRWKMRIGCGCSGWVWRLIGAPVERDSLVAAVEVWLGKRTEIEALEE